MYTITIKIDIRFINHFFSFIIYSTNWLIISYIFLIIINFEGFLFALILLLFKIYTIFSDKKLSYFI